MAIKVDNAEIQKPRHLVFQWGMISNGFLSCNPGSK